MISKTIMTLREQMNWSQQQLAKRLRVSKKSVINWEDDISAASMKSIIEIAKLFNVSADFLLGLDHRPAIYIDSLQPEDREKLQAIARVFISMSQGDQPDNH